jgi:NhaP-type Na+/H+ or K+/H+ antiporter
VKLARLVDAVTALAVIVAMIVIVGGAAEAILNSDRYPAKEYFSDLKILLLGLAAVLLALQITRVRIEESEPGGTTYQKTN